MTPRLRHSTAVFILALSAIFCGHASAAEKPNVLLIIADDMRGDIGAFGNRVVRTPSLDRLAQRAVRFERAYCQLPWCNPSRTSFLSGLRPETTRIWGNGSLPDAELKDGVTFLPEHFKAHGYWAARVGKIFHDSAEFQPWVNAKRFWDVSEKGAGGGYGKNVVAHKVIHGRGTREDILQYTVYDVPEEQTGEFKIAARGGQLIARGVASGKPWLVAVGFHKPHLAWQVPKKYWDLYEPAKIPLTPEPPCEAQKIQQGAGATNTKVPPVSEPERREAIAAYYACISYIDAQVGRLLDALEKSGAAENTIVVFLGDHGYNLGEHYGAWEKVKMWEDTCRTPLLIAAPGAKGNGQPSRRIVELIDLFPTLADLCALPVPKQKLEGVSLRPLLAQPDAEWTRPAFTMVPDATVRGEPQVRGRSVRTARWRYTEFGNGGPGARQLFDHDTDPHEFQNLAADPAHAPTVDELKALLPTSIVRYQR